MIFPVSKPLALYADIFKNIKGAVKSTPLDSLGRSIISILLCVKELEEEKTTISINILEIAIIFLIILTLLVSST